MNCDDVEPLLGAYALDALPAGDAAAVRAHLETCEEHAAKARELRAIALRIAETPERIAVPAALRSRVLDAIAATPQETPRAAPAPARIDARARGDGGAGRIQWRPSNVRFFPNRQFAAMAAALALVIGGLLAWNIVLQRRDNGTDAGEFATRITSVAPLQSSGGAGGGTVLYFAGERKAVILGERMPALDSGKAYQLWAVGQDATPRSLGLMRADASGRMVAVVSYAAAAGEQLAVTVEPAGGSAQPTSPPIFTAKV